MPVLDFKGKQFVYAHHLTVPFRQLTVDAVKSAPARGAKPGLDDNLIIHGDNLHALKALLPKYAGRIKCIYIDPPYNTGTEGWCYNDKVNSPLMQEWLKKEANPVDKEDLERHDKWLAMMWPRLQLFRELLSDNGVIFISIDSIELFALKSILDEIFGEQNFVDLLTVVRSKNGMGSKEGYSTNSDYVLVYTKDYLNGHAFYGIDGSLEYKNKFNKQDKFGIYKTDGLFRKKGEGQRKIDSPGCFYPIFFDDEGNVYLEQRTGLKEVLPKLPDGSDGRWIWSKEFARDKLHRLVAGPKGTVYVKDYWNDSLTEKPKSVLDKSKYITERATEEIKEIFGEKSFPTPKPIALLKDLISNATDRDSIVLDSFAGSGTTAHAVLALNKEDGGIRKFILVECEDYADKVTAERVRRVIKGVPEAKDATLKEGLGGSFTYCELGEDISIENLLKGNNLPSFDELAAYAFYTATGQTLAKVQHGADYMIGETDKYRVHLVYKPDLAFMRGNESALNMPLAKSIAKAREDSKKTALVFASQKFMGQKELTEMGIVFCQLPYALHRIVGA